MCFLCGSSSVEPLWPLWLGLGSLNHRGHRGSRRRATGESRAIVEQHVRLENAHDLEGVLGTFGDTARYDDEPWGEHFNGRDGVRQFYEQLMKALLDLQIEIQRRHVGDEAIILEVMIRGTQLGAWRGLPARDIPQVLIRENR